MTDSTENDGPFASLRRQVEQIEEANRRAGYPVPDGALICLPYPEARALVDAVRDLIPGLRVEAERLRGIGVISVALWMDNEAERLERVTSPERKEESHE